MTSLLQQRDNLNLSLLLSSSAILRPDKVALAVANPLTPDGASTYETLTFGALEKRVDAYAYGFRRLNVSNGARTLLMMKPGIDFVATVFALLRAGAIPVFIDDGMGHDSMLKCIEEVRPHAMIAWSERLQLAKSHPDTFRSVATFVCAGTAAADAVPLDSLRADPPRAVETAHADAEDVSLILFTTGSTGLPKGVEYTPRVVRSQLEAQRSTWNLTEDDVDLSTFPTFVMGTVAIGMKVVIPDINPANPAQADPRRIVQAINDHGATHTFGPPALWDRITRYCLEHDVQLPSMRHVLVAGAPVPASLIRRFPRILPNGQCCTPIGATESNPITNISMDELIGETLALTDEGWGVCVGRPLAGHRIDVIRIVDTALASWDEAEVLGTGEIGELVVSGPVVTRHYFNRPEATAKAKIPLPGGNMSHRLGDTGFVDAKGRVWFCGRRAHIVSADGAQWFPLQVESAFNCEPDIWRSALVGVTIDGVQCLALCIEFRPGQAPADWQLPAQRVHELTAKAARLKFPLRHFLACRDGFPVDIRHNSKINRPRLAEWAQQILGATRKESTLETR